MSLFGANKKVVPYLSTALTSNHEEVRRKLGDVIREAWVECGDVWKKDGEGRMWRLASTTRKGGTRGYAVGSEVEISHSLTDPKRWQATYELHRYPTPPNPTPSEIRFDAHDGCRFCRVSFDCGDVWEAQEGESFRLVTSKRKDSRGVYLHQPTAKELFGAKPKQVPKLAVIKESETEPLTQGDIRAHRINWSECYRQLPQSSSNGTTFHQPNDFLPCFYNGTEARFNGMDHVWRLFAGFAADEWRLVKYCWDEGAHKRCEEFPDGQRMLNEVRGNDRPTDGSLVMIAGQREYEAVTGQEASDHRHHWDDLYRRLPWLPDATPVTVPNSFVPRFYDGRTARFWNDDEWTFVDQSFTKWDRWRLTKTKSGELPPDTGLVPNAPPDGEAWAVPFVRERLKEKLTPNAFAELYPEPMNDSPARVSEAWDDSSEEVRKITAPSHAAGLEMKRLGVKTASEKRGEPKSTGFDPSRYEKRVVFGAGRQLGKNAACEAAVKKYGPNITNAQIAKAYNKDNGTKYKPRKEKRELSDGELRKAIFKRWPSMLNGTGVFKRPRGWLLAVEIVIGILSIATSLGVMHVKAPEAFDRALEFVVGLNPAPVVRAKIIDPFAEIWENGFDDKP